MSSPKTPEELGILTRSPAILSLVETIRQVAPSDLGVLLVGESGVGKEVFARAIHTLSRRSRQRMLAINCGAIPETLLESELFGHEKGAFTGAGEARKGLFESAEGGTVFLDEIGEMPPGTQVRLLRVLESFEFTRVGSSEPRQADVRVIAATNRELEREIGRGAFRQDLYFRLAQAIIRIPPLRERPEDIPLLFAHFAFDTAGRLGVPFGGISREAMELLEEYAWPGNVRELKNFVELVVTLERGERITEQTVLRHLNPHLHRDRDIYVENPSAIVHLPGRTSEQVERELIYRALIDLRNEVGSMKEMLASDRRSERQRTEVVSEKMAPALPPPMPSIEEVLRRTNDLDLEQMERRMISVALERFGGNRRAAAEALGISERTLYRKLNDATASRRGDQTGGDVANGATSAGASHDSNGSSREEEE